MNTKQMIEEAAITCNACGGDGYTVEYDPSDPTGQTPMQVQCNACHAEGKYMTLDMARTLLTKHEAMIRNDEKSKMARIFVDGDAVVVNGDRLRELLKCVGESTADHLRASKSDV